MSRQPKLPLRRDSNASERDFFDIPDETALLFLKRQARRKRTWIYLGLLYFFCKWFFRTPGSVMGLPHIDYNKVDWSRYAYTQYATSETYLCNSLMVFDALERTGSRAERVLFHPIEWDLIVQDESDRISQLLLLAKDNYNVELRPIAIEGIKVEHDEVGHDGGK